MPIPLTWMCCLVLLMSTSQSWALRWTGGKSTTPAEHAFLCILYTNVYYNTIYTCNYNSYDLDIIICKINTTQNALAQTLSTNLYLAIDLDFKDILDIWLYMYTQSKFLIKSTLMQPIFNVH